MQSAQLQYVFPDESLKGKANKGVIAQYPYFAPDRNYMKKAPKMTKADELYLKKFMAARDHKDVAKIENNVIADRQYVDLNDPGDSQVPDGKRNVEINVNQRLFLERNKQFKPEQVSYRSASGDKITLTSKIFGENKYFQQREDTTQDQNMQAYVEETFETSPFVPGGKSRDIAKRTAMTEQKGHTGNVVPFFPSEWKKNANDVFNLIMNGQEPTEDVYDDVTHAAIHRKVPDQESLSPFLQSTKKPPSQTISGGRPTSGKHYAREHQFAKRKGELEPPNRDPLTSSVAKNFEKSKQVESLLNRLAGYMAGEIPDTADLQDLFGKKQPSPNATMISGQPDDATTVMTKDDIPPPPKLQSYPAISKEPIYGPSVLAGPVDQLEADDNQKDPDPPTQPDGNLDHIIEAQPPFEEEDEGLLPNIYASAPSRNFRAKRHTSPVKRKDNENLFIYKDFDTSLTKVKVPVTRLPALNQTTSKRPEDLIRDRLLSFAVKNGQLSQFDYDKLGKKTPTMIDRSISLQ